jgi:hypothetical protein
MAESIKKNRVGGAAGTKFSTGKLCGSHIGRNKGDSPVPAFSVSTSEREEINGHGSNQMSKRGKRQVEQRERDAIENAREEKRNGNGSEPKRGLGLVLVGRFVSRGRIHGVYPRPTPTYSNPIARRRTESSRFLVSTMMGFFSRCLMRSKSSARNSGQPVPTTSASTPSAAA